VIVDRHAVHKAAESEVLIASVEPEPDGRWLTHLVVSRSHWLCRPWPASVPVTLLAEAFRQAGMAVCVLGMGVPADSHFVISAMTVEWDADELAFPRFGAYEAPLHVKITDTETRKGVLHRLHVDYRIEGVATGHVTAQMLNDRDYRVVRRGAAKMTGSETTRADDIIVDPVITETGMSALLGVQWTDPFFFDHPVDHLPGMLLLHGAATLHERFGPATSSRLDIAFLRFGELGKETRIDQRSTDDGMVTTFSQDGVPVAEATIAAARVSA
jgi:2-oxo-3-(phosphooxy)propyl 3-oxoalkanoate synthase